MAHLPAKIPPPPELDGNIATLPEKKRIPVSVIIILALLPVVLLLLVLTLLRRRSQNPVRHL